MHPKVFFYAITWWSVHLAFSAYDFIRAAWTRARNLIDDFSSKFRDPLELIREVEAVARTLKKVPAHLTVILGPEDRDSERAPSYADLAKLLMYSVASGVSFISFYDLQGKFCHLCQNVG